MKNTSAKILWIIMIIVLSTQSLTLYAVTEKEKLQQEQKEINNQIEEAEKKQEQLEKQKSETMKSVESLISQISTVQNEIDGLKEKITNLKNQIEQKESDILKKQEEYNEQEKLLDARLIAMYENGQTSYLDVILTASSFTEMLAKYNAASELIEYDKELMRSTKEQKEQIESEKVQLETAKQELDTSLTKQENKSKELNKLKSEKESEAKKLTEEEKQIQEEIEQLEKDNREIANAIKEAEKKYQQQLEALKNSSSSNYTGSGYFTRPVASNNITARAYYSSGKFHGALDYGIPVGTTVVAAADGVVMTTANLSGSYGTYVVIRHANGLQSYYAHGKKGSIVVNPGDTVKKGQKIMLSGNTGNSNGPHLHFEVRKSPYNYSYTAKAYGQDSRVNPENYL